jgi:ApbE superfamily uncharacterized protein (UPF0280 family)
MTTARHERRFYRNLVRTAELVSFRVVVKETDLYIHAEKNLANTARELVFQQRGYLETYIKQHPAFAEALKPWRSAGPVPHIIGDMVQAGQSAGVGPMAAVAGAVAQRVGKALLRHSEEVIVENGGDVFLTTGQPAVVGIFAGSSPLSLQVGVKVGGGSRPISICTSSATVGHSLSMGRADAVSVVSGNCALADAVATSTGNRIQTRSDIQKAIAYGRQIDGVEGLVIILDDQIALWGDLELVPLQVKKG